MKQHKSQVWRRGARCARAFFCADDGAVTVDWVVLTAAIVGLGIAAGFTVSSSVPDLANAVGTFVASQTVMPN